MNELTLVGDKLLIVGDEKVAKNEGKKHNYFITDMGDYKLRSEYYITIDNT